MAAQRTSKTPPALPPRIDRVTIPGSGEKRRHITPGVQVTIERERGTFIVKWIDEDGTLACYGGPSGRERMRAFKPERVRKIKHNPVTR